MQFSPSQLTQLAPTRCILLTRIMRSCSTYPPCCHTHPTISNRYVNLQGSELGYTKIPLDPPASCGFSLEKVVIHAMHIFRVNMILFFVYIDVVKEDMQRFGKTEEDARGWCQIEADNSLWRPLKAETTVAQVLLFFPLDVYLIMF